MSQDISPLHKLLIFLGVINVKVTEHDTMTKSSIPSGFTEKTHRDFSLPLNIIIPLLVIIFIIVIPVWFIATQPKLTPEEKFTKDLHDITDKEDKMQWQTVWKDKPDKLEYLTETQIELDKYNCTDLRQFFIESTNSALRAYVGHLILERSCAT